MFKLQGIKKNIERYQKEQSKTNRAEAKRCQICRRLLPPVNKVITRHQTELLDRLLFVLQRGTSQEIVAAGEIVKALYRQVLDRTPAIDIESAAETRPDTTLALWRHL